MGAEVLPARDYLAHYQGYRSDHFMGMMYQHAQVHQYGKKSPEPVQSKKKNGHRHGSSAQKPKSRGENPEKKRPLKPKPQEESFQLEVVKRGAVNRIIKSSNCKSGYGDEQGLRKEPKLDIDKEPAKNIVLVGQVTILKRGQALKPNTNEPSQLEIKKTGSSVLSSTETLGPDRTSVTKNRTPTSRSASSKESKAASPPSAPKLPGLNSERGNGIKKHNFPIQISEKWAGPAYTNSPSPSCLPFPKFSTKKSGEESAEIDRFATRDLRRLLGLD